MALKFFSRLGMIRYQDGISQKEFASLLGISRQTLASLEAATKRPTFETAYRIAKYVKRPMEEIFFFKEMKK
jgi:putative transcriptional regulator